MTQFLPIPAIDLLNGNCVRLEQGDYAKVTQYSADPAQQAIEFAAAGASRLHVVDLDGARSGTPANLAAVTAIRAALNEVNPAIELELGGGLRNLDAVAQALAGGADLVVLGTAAITDPGFLQKACQAYPEQILLGLDARDGKLAVKGWVETTTIDLTDFARQAVEYGIAGIIHTDIARDGLLSGPNTAVTTALAAQVTCPVYASGGITSLADVAQLRNAGLAGAIIGKAIYAGKIAVADLFTASAANA